MIEARAIYITHVHNRQVCLFIFVYREFLKDVKLNLGILRTLNIRSPLSPIFYDIQAFKSWAIQF